MRRGARWWCAATPPLPPSGPTLIRRELTASTWWRLCRRQRDPPSTPPGVPPSPRTCASTALWAPVFAQIGLYVGAERETSATHGDAASGDTSMFSRSPSRLGSATVGPQTLRNGTTTRPRPGSASGSGSHEPGAAPDSTARPHTRMGFPTLTRPSMPWPGWREIRVSIRPRKTRLKPICSANSALLRGLAQCRIESVRCATAERLLPASSRPTSNTSGRRPPTVARSSR